MKFSPYVVTILTIAAIALVMSGCSKHHEENTADYSMPEEMKDCKVFYIAPDGMGSPIHVVYCPGKTTVAERYAVGKTHRDVNVVVGESSAQFSDDSSASTSNNSNSRAESYVVTQYMKCTPMESSTPGHSLQACEMVDKPSK